MQKRMWQNAYRTTVVCVDSYDDGVLAGRMYNPGLQNGERFHGLMQFLIKMEDLLDTLQFPTALHGQPRLFPCAGTGRFGTGIRAASAGEARDLCAQGTVPAKCQLAGFCYLAGRRERRELSQRAGIGAVDGQRPFNGRGLTQCAVQSASENQRRGEPRNEITETANRLKGRDAKPGG